MTDRELMQPEPPCKTGSQCVGGKCDRCAEPEPVAWLDEEGFSWVPGELPDEYAKDCKPLYLAPPQHEWVGLTDEERLALWYGIKCDLECLKPAQYARAIEAKLKEKNND